MKAVRWFFLVSILLAAVMVVAGAGAADITAQNETEAPHGIYRGVTTAERFDVSPPLRSIEPAEFRIAPGSEIPERPSGLEGPLGPQSVDPVVQSAVGPGLIPSPTVSFDGPGNIFSVSPPDPVGDVGPNHYVAMSNLSFQIFDKTGVSLLGPLPNNTLWAGFGGDCETDNAGDPIVIHDQISDRWMLSQFTSSGPTYFNCVAVSTTPDPVGTYYRYAFSTGTNFPDYPKYGWWPDALYISTREFAGAFVGIGAYAIDRADLISGNPSAQVINFLITPAAAGGAFNVGDGLLPSDMDGSMLPPANSPNYFVGSMDDGGQYGAPQDALTLWEFNADFTDPPSSTFLLEDTIPVAPFDSQFPCSPTSRNCIPQPDTSNKVDILSYRQRPMWRLAYRNFGDHEALVTNQSVEAAPNMAGIRWYEIRDPGGTPTIYQEGTYAPGVVDGIHRWMGSIAMDSSGNMALGYSASDATTTYPSSWYTGRLSNDPLGTMPQGEASIIDGTGSQTGSGRWGDYTSMNLDPVDDCTFWYVNQYIPTTSSVGWRLRIGAFRFDQCGSPDFTLSATPDTQSICAPADAIYDITVGQVVTYTDPVTLSAAGNPAGTSTNFSTNPVIPPGSSVLTVGNTGAGAAGSYDIDIVGVAPTSTHTTTVQLNLFDVPPLAPALVAPADGAVDVPLLPDFSWTPAGINETGYLIEVATDAGFSNIVISGTVSSPSFTPASALDPLTEYFWRVSADNPCGASPYSAVFSFTTQDIPPVLLVDDDDNLPDVQGTYVTALNTILGVDGFDIWDTNNSDNEPNAATLSAYDVVVWFSGDEFGGFAGPGSAGESALATWLDAGGCLFLSSQDYHYDRDQTPFMTNYLGVSSITDDSGNYTSVTGQGSIFGGLGPYSLSYPFTDFSDIISPNGTAELAFQGNNGNGAAVSKITGNYVTAFLVYPWEAISSSSGREDVLQTMFDACGTELEPEITVTPSSVEITLPQSATGTSSFDINNVGMADLDWTIEEAASGGCGSPSDVTWLEVSPDNGTTPSGGSTTVDVGFDTEELAVGVYPADLCVNSNDPATPQLVVPVTMTVESNVTFVPVVVNETTTAAAGNAGAIFAGLAILPAGMGVLFLPRLRKER